MKQTRVVSHLAPSSIVAEAFRIIRTNLKFSTPAGSVLKSLLITSAGPGEGKSTTIANLGTIMAQSGANVIIVDGDLRKGEQHILFNLGNGMGFSDLLTRDLDIKRVIKDTKVPNLRVITSGLLPANPAELLESSKTRKVISQLSEIVDVVLVDSPPELIVTDAKLISSVVDGVILVIRSSVTKTDAILKTKKHLEKASARIIGTILNDVKKIESDYSCSAYHGYFSSPKVNAANSNLDWYEKVGG